MMKLFLLMVISVLLPAIPRTEDPEAASLGGRVSDQGGAPIAGARISVRNKFSGEVEIAKSDEAGLYRVAGLRQGQYSVFAQAEGYGCSLVLNVLLFRGRHTKLNLTLTDSRKKVPSVNCMELIRSTQ
jgi:hypothetical protein